ncbi:26S proteasome regulatory subunit RPN2 [Rhodotorula toruloides]|uniref:26S proteasome regulatory subunit RPN2 n=1 Tax=Rhodotorula toruloides TaxID=5286 RepID=A0A0K3CFE6_RHOTO|nr:26S proteasome regulatory subunit RPN2 [Rhodotorula toruloides]PRQ75993.1 26S proteasome non-ATPase regulatory subunit 1 [Rhodotorula toruloides]
MVQSAQGLLSLLDEPEAALQAHALSNINQRIDQFWAEVADHVVKIEALSEDASFPSRQLASLVASKLYYHLGNLDEALAFALGAGKLFDVEPTGDVSPGQAEYVETVISKAIDSYTAARSASAPSAAFVDPARVPRDVDARLEAVVERMFERCERDGEFKQGLGVALSSHRLDVVQRVFNKTKDASLLEWILDIVVRESVAVGGTSRSYKSEILQLLIKLFESLPSPDYFSITQCFVFLNDPSLASSLLAKLLNLDSSEPPKDDAVLTAYQIAFDLAETASQEFLQVVRTSVAGSKPEAVEGAEGAPAAEEAEPKEGAELHRERLATILSGEESIKLYLEFLYRNNKADLLILKDTLSALEPRNSIYHSAISLMNAFAHAGTTSDLFLRENLDFLGKASNWSKFTTTAALGVIHKGNLTQGKAILEPYLPRSDGGGATKSVYSEGGSLYALGLVNANHGKEDIVKYLMDTLKSSQDEVIQHGAALGLGVAAMGSGNEELYEELRNVLFTDSAIAGEAAGYAMGLVMLGTASEKAFDEMLQYAHETQHEKIIRGLAVGLAFLMYGKEEEADSLIDTLGKDADAILRYGGMYAVALAYAGTGNNKAIRKLLHVAVSDVSDDVRRAAVTALGFILFRNPTQVPRIVQLLAESYNPHVRYGSALALGISCAGTGLEEAIALLEPLTKDPVDFVRQGACVSLAMVLIEQNETSHPKVASTRELYKKIVSDKHADPMAKFGAALSQGIIDAGGRNVTISMQNKSGSGNMPSIVGMALFAQFWYWFPLTHCLSLAFTPTAIIGVDKDLKIPKFEFVSNAKPSLFAYQPATKPPTKETVEKVKTAVLSTTAKVTARAKAKEAEQGKTEAMETDEKAEEKPAESTDDAEMKVDEAAGEDKKKDQTKRKAPEPSSSRLENLSRVTPAQLQYISFPSDSRYVPVRPVNSGSAPAPSSLSSVTSSRSAPPVGFGGGILLMRDTKPGEAAEFHELEVLKAIDTAGAGAAAPAEGAAGQAAAGGDDADLLTGPIADPPAPFEWTDWGSD